jgi:N6-L-threonylcarbamoyladenine synthase
MLVLGIETSCDETAAAVVADGAPGPRILSDLVRSQLDEHTLYGGVVPEIAARAHLDHLEPVVRRALAVADIGPDQLDGVAAAAGPGLIGGLIVGTMMAKGVAWAAGTPFIAVNHLEAHALSVRLITQVDFPYLLLLASGGHCQLLACLDVDRFTRLGTTRDDAAGEAFDKTARLLGFGYPGGPAIECAARGGDPRRFALPRPLLGRPGCDFSFSGLKTAVRRIASENAPLDRQDQCDLAAAVEAAICDALCDRTSNAIACFLGNCPRGRTLVAAGGVAANARLRRRLADLAASAGLDFIAPPPALCTDNAAMVAWAGLERLRLGLVDDLSAPLRPRWPLDLAAPSHRGVGAST